MLQSLTGVLYEIPSEIPRTIRDVRTWWAAVVGHPESRVHVESVDSSPSSTFFGLVVPLPIVTLNPAIIVDDITHETEFKAVEKFENESILKWFTTLPITADRFPIALLACPHPIVTSHLSSQPHNIAQVSRLIKNNPFALMALLHNPDRKFVNAVKRADIPDYHPPLGFIPNGDEDEEDGDIEQLLKRPYVATESSLYFFQTDDERVIRHIWEGLIRYSRLRGGLNNMMFMRLPVNDHPVAVELILRDFDKYELFRYRFVYMLENEEVVRKCLAKNLGNLLMRNPHPLAVEATLARFASDRDFQSENWQLALANRNPKMMEWCWEKLMSSEPSEPSSSTTKQIDDWMKTLRMLQSRNTAIAPPLMTKILQYTFRIIEDVEDVEDVEHKISLSWILRSYLYSDEFSLEIV